jgi:hypothetical protein
MLLKDINPILLLLNQDHFLINHQNQNNVLLFMDLLKLGGSKIFILNVIIDLMHKKWVEYLQLVLEDYKSNKAKNLKRDEEIN